MQSEVISDLIGALAKASLEFDAATKSSINPHFKSRYANLEAVISATAPALNRNGLAVIQRMTTDDTLVTTLAHASGQWISGEQKLHAAKLDPQGIGSAATYARRYGWMAIVGIAPEDDDGNAGSNPPGAGRDQGQNQAPGATSISGLSVTACDKHQTKSDPKRDYWVVAFSNGGKASTFSSTFAGVASAALESGKLVSITVEKNGDFFNLTGIA